MEIEIIDNLTSSSTTAGLAANQGRVLSSKIGELGELTTEAKGSIILAINELKTDLNELETGLDEINGEVI